MNNDNIRIDVSGGDWTERELITDLVATSLSEKGFTDVHSVNSHGLDDTVVERFLPKTIFAALQTVRPDLVNRRVDVVPEQYEFNDPSTESFVSLTRQPSAPVYHAVSHGNLVVADRTGEATMQQTIDAAQVARIPATEIGIRGMHVDDVLHSARVALENSPNSFVTLSLGGKGSYKGEETIRMFAPDRHVQAAQPRTPPWRDETAQLREAIATDLVTSEGFQNLVQDIARDMIDERMQDVQRNISEQTRSVGDIAKTVSQNILREVDEKIAKSHEVDPETMQELENVVAELQARNEARSRDAAAEMKKSSKPSEDNIEFVDEAILKGHLNNRASDYVPPNGAESREAVKKQFKKSIKNQNGK